MRTIPFRFLLTLLVLLAGTIPSRAQRSAEPFSFIVSSDQRDHATEPFRTREFTLAGYEAINKAGKGSFMIVVGDMDPPTATNELIATVLGQEYLWYPVIGNHDIEVEANTEFLRKKNRGEQSLPYVVRKGPAGCEETTYSFDWNGVHFVILNVYYDGKSDKGTDGNIVPELLSWLEEDLMQNTKKRILVFGHEPLYPFLDMDNGTARHLADALDKYPDNAIIFHRLLVKHGVSAYFSGHTHCASYANINGLWLINSGHIYGQEDHFTPKSLYASLSDYVKAEASKGLNTEGAIAAYYKADDKEMKKFVFSLGIENVKAYKELTDDQTLRHLTRFFTDCEKGDSELERYTSLFWRNTEMRKSTFLKVGIDNNAMAVEFYRDKDYGGNYELRDRVIVTYPQ